MKIQKNEGTNLSIFDRNVQVWMKRGPLMYPHSSETLSKFTVKVCNVEHGKRGARAISTLLPVLLDIGITSGISEVDSVVYILHIIRKGNYDYIIYYIHDSSWVFKTSHFCLAKITIPPCSRKSKQMFKSDSFELIQYSSF